MNKKKLLLLIPIVAGIFILLLLGYTSKVRLEEKTKNYDDNINVIIVLELADASQINDRERSVQTNFDITYTKAKILYKVQKGDTIAKIAEHFNLTLDEISALNPTIKNIKKIKVGENIVVEERVGRASND